MARAYDASARELSALETRRRILDAAQDLMLGGGYRAMTINELAVRAQVSTQTVYNSVGGKGAVVKAVYDKLLAGDDDAIAMSERPEFLAIRDAPDLETWATAYAAWARSIMVRVGPLLGALLEHGPAGDPVLEDLVASMDRERRTGNDNSLRRLLPRATTRSRAVDAVWTLTAPEVYDRLVTKRGWSHQAYEAWLARQLHTCVEPSLR
jgi:AcrR family transcriptional regulator